MNPNIIDQKTHKIASEQLNNDVISVVKKLKKAGFLGYIVGGGVRDLLLGYKPKDFDIATDAKPEQVRKIFKNSRIIGRRFRLVHIYFGREIIEVATFRSNPSAEQVANNDINADHATLDGRIIRDNVYGTIEEDAWRRDFSINALYYDPIDGVIVDYCNGFEDLNSHSLRILGNPETRYREDPVRLLRALRFSAKIDFKIERKTLAPIKNQEICDLLDDIPRSRLFEEYNKLFLYGHAEKTFYLLKEYNLLHKLFPLTATQELEDIYPQHISFLHAVLQSTDNRFDAELPINPAFLIAAFLWHPLQLEHQNLTGGRSKNNKEYIWRQAAHKTIKKQNLYLSIPKRFTKVMEDIWYLQRLFNKTNYRSIEKAANHPKFRAGFDFLNIRSTIEPVNEHLLKWWQKFERSNEKARYQLLEQYEPQQ